MTRTLMLIHCLLMCVVSVMRPCQGAAKPDHERYTFNHLETTLSHNTQQHLITEYELGEVNWTHRVINALGVGTHTILSPTGGWGQTDLRAVAVENARQKLERLSAELYQSLTLSGCHWGHRSQMFQAPRVRWMSDGSVHLPVVIRFEVYEQCRRKQHKKTSAVTSTLESKMKRSPAQEETALEKAQLIRDLEETLQTDSRAVVFAEMKHTGHAAKTLGGDISCLSPIPQLALQAHGQTLDARSWRAIRWLWAISPKSSDRHTAPTPFKSRIKSSVNLGELECLQGAVNSIAPILQPKRVTASGARELREVINAQGGAELWIWVKR